MMSGVTKRMSSLEDVTVDTRLPGYNPSAHGCGIVHLGIGAFHRAHQAVYTDDALAAAGGDWRITGVSLRGTEIADALNPQNGLYTLIEQDSEGTRGRVVASIDRVIAASRDRHSALEALLLPETRIVTLTVTEKAYGIDRQRLAADPIHPAVAADLANPREPSGVLGLITEGLRLRRKNATPPFVVLCCDNLPENGFLLKAGVVDYALRIDPELAGWIADNVLFPSSMVDRITPAVTEATGRQAERLTGCADHAAVETEVFSQWVIEDKFPNGRPAWEAGGALFVEDVKPYEMMKLRMLNGAHSMLAYSGFLAGHKYVRDVMADENLASLVDRHIRAASLTLPDLPGIDLDQYRGDLLGRFANPAIAHETYQIAMDGTQKLPQRIFEPAVQTLEEGGDLQPYAFAVAAWMRYCTGKTDEGLSYELRDPRQTEIESAISGLSLAADISAALHALPDLFNAELMDDATWRSLVEQILGDMLTSGVHAAIAHKTEIGKAGK